MCIYIYIHIGESKGVGNNVEYVVPYVATPQGSGDRYAINSANDKLSMNWLNLWQMSRNLFLLKMKVSSQSYDFSRIMWFKGSSWMSTWFFIARCFFMSKRPTTDGPKWKQLRLPPWVRWIATCRWSSRTQAYIASYSSMVQLNDPRKGRFLVFRLLPFLDWLPWSLEEEVFCCRGFLARSINWSRQKTVLIGQDVKAVEMINILCLYHDWFVGYVSTQSYSKIDICICEPSCMKVYTSI